jgi:hypothetical protein
MTMEYMVFEDAAGIAIFCALIGVGVTIFIAVMAVYLTVLSFMEDHYDR